MRLRLCASWRTKVGRECVGICAAEHANTVNFAGRSLSSSRGNDHSRRSGQRPRGPPNDFPHLRCVALGHGTISYSVRGLWQVLLPSVSPEWLVFRVGLVTSAWVSPIRRALNVNREV